jgi:hypothetical protein
MSEDSAEETDGDFVETMVVEADDLELVGLRGSRTIHCPGRRGAVKRPQRFHM